MKSLRPLLALALAAVFTGCCCSGTCKKDAAPAATPAAVAPVAK